MAADTDSGDTVVLDRARLLRVVDGDLDLMRDLIDLYLSTIHESLATVSHCREQGDMRGIHHVTHRLKTSIANLGGRQVHRTVTELDRLARAGSMDDIDERLTRMEQELAEFGSELRHFRAETAGQSAGAGSGGM